MQSASMTGMEVKKVTCLLNIKKTYTKTSRWKKKGARNSKQRSNEQGLKSNRIFPFFQPLCGCVFARRCMHTYQAISEEATATFETVEGVQWQRRQKDRHCEKIYIKTIILHFPKRTGTDARNRHK